MPHRGQSWGRVHCGAGTAIRQNIGGRNRPQMQRTDRNNKIRQKAGQVHRASKVVRPHHIAKGSKQTAGAYGRKTLEIVQALYERKIVTYPRTDSKYISEDMAYGIGPLVTIADHFVSATMSDGVFAKEFSPNVPLIVDNGKVTDHHAFLPTAEIGKIKANSLGADERNILLMICSRLVCAVNEKHAYAETTVTVECQDEIFTAQGKAVISNGWKQAEDKFLQNIGGKKASTTESGDSENKALPTNLAGGQKFTAKTSVREGFTSPPKHYTEDTLLSAMENAGVEGVEEEIERRGLGTPATRAGILEVLVKSELLKRDKKNLLPTDKGVNLIKVLPEKVKSPLLTASWENDLKRNREEVTVRAS